MQNPQNSSPSTGQKAPSTLPFLQDSSLVTQLSSDEPGQLVQSSDLKVEQKLLSPPKPSLAQLDSQGGIRINITIPASALTLGQLLGEGAYGSVYQGVWNDQLVAIKRLKAQHLTEKAVEELRREAQIMFQLGVESKYIVPLKKICLEAPYYSLVMELMPKGSLYQLLHNAQELPWSIRFQIALDAAWGLKDLHGYSILHRDLKSLNILLDDRLRAKLADFGLAKVKQETSSQSTMAKGTVLWMAPELFKRRAEITAAVDIWSLGMVLWELASREIPFKDAQNQLQAATWIKDGEKEEIPNDCPAELKAIIESCWDLTPVKRPTAIQVVDRLKPLIVVSDEKQKLPPPTSSQAENQLKPGAPTDSKDEEMKKLQEKVRQLELEKAKEEKRRKDLEEKYESVQPSLSQNRYPPMPAPKPTLTPTDQKSLSQLLQYVAEGEQDKAEELIQKDKNLPLHAGTVTDLSGREFKPITAFQYALWAMDWHMWTMIQKYLPQEVQMQQLQDLETQGTSHGKHFSLQDLIGTLQTYVDNASKWNYGQRATDHWCKIVGGQQKLLPVHLVNEYCRPGRVFEPCPAEWKSKLPRIHELKIWDSAQSKYVKGSWFIPSSSKDGLGLTYAFYRYNYEYVRGSRLRERRARWSGPNADLKALQSLWMTRTQQLEALQFQLLSTPSQNQRSEAELKHEQKNLKYESPIQPLKLMPPLSQTIAQTILPPPKLKANPTQLALQDQLIEACKQGDEKTVKVLLQQGAKPDMANAKGEQPLGAAVWGMCPDVVNALLKQAGSIAPMTWGECEKHNLKYYKEVFIISKFDPSTYGKWYTLLQKMDPNPFIRAYHLKKADEQWHDKDTSSWENWISWVRDGRLGGWWKMGGAVASKTETGYFGFRTQIKQTIESAKQPTVQLNS